jgi:4-hydroxy-tetrahydrodipicolinate synthase
MEDRGMQLEGVYTPVVTPFDEQGEIDFETLTRVIEYQVQNGVRGIVSCGTTGEYYACTFDERLALMAHTRDVTQGEAQLVAGCNSGSTREVIRLGTAARELGYDALLLSAPHTSLPSQAELGAHYAAVASGVGLPIILYNYPARAGVEIGVEALDAIADLPEIVAIKESSGDFSRFLSLRRRYRGRIEVMCGSDDQAVDYFSWGVRSWLAGTANVLPRQHVAVLESALRGDHALAHRLFEGMLPWVQDMESGSYNQKAKLGLAHVGIDCGSVRQPLLALAPETAAETLRVLDDALAVELPERVPAG